MEKLKACAFAQALPGDVMDGIPLSKWSLFLHGETVNWVLRKMEARPVRE